MKLDALRSAVRYVLGASFVGVGALHFIEQLDLDDIVAKPERPPGEDPLDDEASHRPPRPPSQPPTGKARPGLRFGKGGGPAAGPIGNAIVGVLIFLNPTSKPIVYICRVIKPTVTGRWIDGVRGFLAPPNHSWRGQSRGSPGLP